MSSHTPFSGLRCITVTLAGYLLLCVSCSEPDSPGQTYCQGIECGKQNPHGNDTTPGDNTPSDVAIIPDPNEECSKSCTDLGLECGDHCGQSCGTCTGAQEMCITGKCVCVPACESATCEQIDGCGGACGLCPNPQNCTNCLLKLAVVDQAAINGSPYEVILALDYTPSAEDPMPGMADIRFTINGPVELSKVGVGPSILEAEKTLYVDPATGKPFRILVNGTYQILVFSTGNTKPIAAGRWLFLNFRYKPGSPEAYPGWSSQPVVVSLVKREAIFAPPPADAVLWMDTFDTPVVIWPEVTP